MDIVRFPPSPPNVMIMVNVICMKWGNKFPPYYVNRLFGMVKRNLTIPFRFVCFTDEDSGIRPEVEIKSLPNLNLPEDSPERGWRKLTVFKKNFGNLEGMTLFLDLDVIIVDNIDSFFSYPGKFLIAHDKKRPNKIEGNSSVFRFTIGAFPQILEFFENNIDIVKNEVRHEQAYLSREMHKLGKLSYWPDEWVPSFKYRCCPNWLMSWFKSPFIPDNSKIILFHGLPNPPEAAIGISGKWYRHIKPAKWVNEFWVD